VPHLVGVPWLVYPLVVVAIAVIVLLPRWQTVVPSPLVAIVLVTVVTVAAGIRVPTVGDEGDLPSGLPGLVLPHVPMTLETLRIIAPYALGMALVGLLESLMTAKLVDDITDTHSDKTREAWGQGAANIVTGFFGGIGGCAMIGQTMINVKVAGARTRISTFLAGVFLLVLVVSLQDVVGRIPMAALAAVMVMVSVTTFDWRSIRWRTLRRMPRSETSVMVVTVLATVVTSNLAIGVVLGVVVASVLFVRRVAHLTQVRRVVTPGGTGPGGPDDVVTYTVTGELLFASSNDLVYQFDYADDPPHVVIDMSGAHVWDESSVAALDAITAKHEAKGRTVTIRGLHGDSATRHERLSQV